MTIIVHGRIYNLSLGGAAIFFSPLGVVRTLERAVECVVSVSSCAIYIIPLPSVCCRVLNTTIFCGIVRCDFTRLTVRLDLCSLYICIVVVVGSVSARADCDTSGTSGTPRPAVPQSRPPVSDIAYIHLVSRRIIER